MLTKKKIDFCRFYNSLKCTLYKIILKKKFFSTQHMKNKHTRIIYVSVINTFFCYVRDFLRSTRLGHKNIFHVR